MFRSSQLVYSEWLYGLVLYAGEDSKLYKMQLQTTTDKPSFFARKSKLFFLMAYLHVLFMTAVISHHLKCGLPLCFLLEKLSVIFVVF